MEKLLERDLKYSLQWGVECCCEKLCLVGFVVPLQQKRVGSYVLASFHALLAMGRGSRLTIVPGFCCPETECETDWLSW